MTWGKLDKKTKTTTLSRFSENSWSSNPLTPPSDLPCPNQPNHTELPPPQTVGTSPQRQGRSPHLRDYRRLQMSVWCVCMWRGGKKKKPHTHFTWFGIESKDKESCDVFFIFWRGSTNRWQLPVGCHLVWCYLCPTQVGGAAEIAFSLLSPLGNL